MAGRCDRSKIAPIHFGKNTIGTAYNDKLHSYQRDALTSFRPFQVSEIHPSAVYASAVGSRIQSVEPRNYTNGFESRRPFLRLHESATCDVVDGAMDRMSWHVVQEL